MKRSITTNYYIKKYRYTVTDELIAADGEIKWETELSEEQQSRLFAEYEAEMLERERREKRKSQNISLEDNV